MCGSTCCSNDPTRSANAPPSVRFQSRRPEHPWLYSRVTRKAAQLSKTELLGDAGPGLHEGTPIGLDHGRIVLCERDCGMGRLQRVPDCIEHGWRVHAAVEARQHLATLPGVGRELFVAAIVHGGREPCAAELLLLRLDLADEDRELAEMRAGHAWPGIALHPANGRGLHARPLCHRDPSIPGEVDRALG